MFCHGARKRSHASQPRTPSGTCQWRLLGAKNPALMSHLLKFPEGDSDSARAQDISVTFVVYKCYLSKPTSWPQLLGWAQRRPWKWPHPPCAAHVTKLYPSLSPNPHHGTCVPCMHRHVPPFEPKQDLVLTCQMRQLRLDQVMWPAKVPQVPKGWHRSSCTDIVIRSHPHSANIHPACTLLPGEQRTGGKQ